MHLESQQIYQNWLNQNPSTRRKFDVTKYLFDKQLEFVLDPSRFKTACCGGRAGKTIADAAYLIKEAIEHPGSRAIYITLSRINAKRLVWPEILKINREFNLGGKVNETDLVVSYGDSFIWVSGAATRGDIEKFRGHPIRLCIIDEVQSFPTYLRALIEEVILTRLYDYNGILALTGTPGPTPTGYFYDACNNPKYKHFYWTMFENPWLQSKSGQTAQQILEETLALRGIDANHPSIQREVFGKWSLDTTNLVLNYSKEKNHYDNLPPHETYSYIMGIDLGFKDADAICILGHHNNSATTYLVHEDIKTKQGLSELFNHVEALRKLYEPYKIVIDTGGLGLKIAEEMRRRWSIPVYAAEKNRKFENLEILGDALRTSRFMAKHDSRFAHDALLLEWDVDKAQPDRRVISNRFHSDIIDSVLYAFRESPGYAYEVPRQMPKFGTAEWGRDQEAEMQQAAEEHFKSKEITTEMEWI